MSKKNMFKANFKVMGDVYPSLGESAVNESVTLF